MKDIKSEISQTRLVNTLTEQPNNMKSISNKANKYSGASYRPQAHKILHMYSLRIGAVMKVAGLRS